MNLNSYPNLEAILNGTVAGSFRDWIAVRPELEKLVAEMTGLAAHQCQHPAGDEFGNAYCTEIKRLRDLSQDVRVDNFAAPGLREIIKNLEARVKELETVLKLVQQWGADARSADSYEVFQAVKLSLIDPAPSREVKVVDCTCVPCICFTPHEVVLGSYCLGCGSRTCLAHELVKTSSRPSQVTKSREDPE